MWSCMSGTVFAWRGENSQWHRWLRLHGGRGLGWRALFVGGGNYSIKQLSNLYLRRSTFQENISLAFLQIECPTYPRYKKERKDPPFRQPTESYISVGCYKIYIAFLSSSNPAVLSWKLTCSLDYVINTEPNREYLPHRKETKHPQHNWSISFPQYPRPQHYKDCSCTQYKAVEKRITGTYSDQDQSLSST